MIDDPPVRRREMDETLDAIDGPKLPVPILVGIAAILGLLGLAAWLVTN